MKFIIPHLYLIFTLSPCLGAEDTIKKLYDQSVALGDKPIDSKILLSPGHELRCRVSVTSKGNGTITIGGLMIRSHDKHADNVQFEGGTLQHHFVDVDADGNRDLVVSGTALISDEKGDKIVKREAVIGVFLYDQLTRKLKETVTSDYLHTTKIAKL